MNKKNHLLMLTPVLILIILFSLVACGRNSGGSTEQNSSALATAAMATIQAQSVLMTIQAQSALLTAQAGGEPLAGAAQASPTWTGGPPTVTPWPGAPLPTFTSTPWQQQPAGPMTTQVRFTEIGKCDKSEYAFFEVANTSSYWMKSQDVTMLEHGSNRALGQTRVPERPFLMAPLGCGGVTDLKAGSTGFINAKFKKQPAPGAQVDASITLCSEPNYVGKCTSVLVQFNYPGQTSQPSQPEILAVQVNFNNIHYCSDSFYAIFELVNNGTLAVKSSQITLTWKGTTDLIGQTTSNLGGYLTDKNGCVGGPKTVEPGTNAFARATMGSTMPYPSRAVDALVKCCSEQNLGGKCTEIKFPFTVPNP